MTDADQARWLVAFVISHVSDRKAQEQIVCRLEALEFKNFYELLGACWRASTASRRGRHDA